MITSLVNFKLFFLPAFLTRESLMSERMITAPPDAEPWRPSSMMALRKIRCILIVEGGKLLGIVSQGDVHRTIFQIGPVMEQESEKADLARRSRS